MFDGELGRVDFDWCPGLKDSLIPSTVLESHAIGMKKWPSKYLCMSPISSAQKRILNTLNERSC